MRSWIPSAVGAGILAGLLLASTAAVAVASDKDEKKPAKLKKNQAYVAPDFAARGIKRIALAPPTAIENSKPEEVEKLATQAFGAAFQSLGYQIVPPTYLREQGAKGEVNDELASLYKSFLAGGGSLDTVAAHAVALKIPVDAILYSHMTTWQRVLIDPYTRGQSFTQLGGDMALYSLADGAVLWRGAFQEKMDGPYNEPMGGDAAQIDPSGNAAKAARLEPPGFPEVLQKLAQRAAGTMPKAAADAAAPAKPN